MPILHTGPTAFNIHKRAAATGGLGAARDWLSHALRHVQWSQHFLEDGSLDI